LLTVTSIKAVKCILSLLFDSPSYLLQNFAINICILLHLVGFLLISSIREFRSRTKATEFSFFIREFKVEHDFIVAQKRVSDEQIQDLVVECNDIGSEMTVDRDINGDTHLQI